VTDSSSDLQLDTTTIIGHGLTEQLRLLMGRALPLELHDDRFDAWPTGIGEGAPSSTASPSGFGAALATAGDTLTGFLGGTVNREEGRLDALVAPGPAAPEDVLESLIEAVAPLLAAAGPPTVEIWAKPAQPWHLAIAEQRSLTELRALHQMRCALPVAIEPIPSRAYRPDDLEGVLAVNNRAFHAHPDQGNQTVESLRATMAEPWFRPEGLRVYERDGRIAGFCWTKIHAPRPSPTEPDTFSSPLGEIYVIGIDPDFHGQGLGAPMTAAGLHWLHEQGLGTGMLYVEADNVPAVRTYERLGFDIVRTDRAWLL